MEIFAFDIGFDLTMEKGISREMEESQEETKQLSGLNVLET